MIPFAFLNKSAPPVPVPQTLDLTTNRTHPSLWAGDASTYVISSPSSMSPPAVNGNHGFPFFNTFDINFTITNFSVAGSNQIRLGFAGVPNHDQGHSFWGIRITSSHYELHGRQTLDLGNSRSSTPSMLFIRFLRDGSSTRIYINSVERANLPNTGNDYNWSDGNYLFFYTSTAMFINATNTTT